MKAASILCLTQSTLASVAIQSAEDPSACNHHFQTTHHRPKRKLRSSKHSAKNLLEFLEDSGDWTTERHRVITESQHVASGARHTEEGASALLFERRSDLLGGDLELHFQIHELSLERVLWVARLARRVNPPLRIELLLWERTQIQHHFRSRGSTTTFFNSIILQRRSYEISVVFAEASSEKMNQINLNRLQFNRYKSTRKLNLRESSLKRYLYVMIMLIQWISC